MKYVYPVLSAVLLLGVSFSAHAARTFYLKQGGERAVTLDTDDDALGMTVVEAGGLAVHLLGVTGEREVENVFNQERSASISELRPFKFVLHTTYGKSNVTVHGNQASAAFAALQAAFEVLQFGASKEKVSAIEGEGFSTKKPDPARLKIYKFLVTTGYGPRTAQIYAADEAHARVAMQASTKIVRGLGMIKKIELVSVSNCEDKISK